MVIGYYLFVCLLYKPNRLEGVKKRKMVKQLVLLGIEHVRNLGITLE